MTSRRRGNSEGSAPVQRRDGRWQVNLRYVDPLGVARRVSVSGRTAQEARAKAKDVRDRVAAGQPARDHKATVGETVETWIGSALAVSDRKPATKAMYTTVGRKHIAGAAIGAVPLDRLRPSHVEAWIVELRGRKLADSTIRSAYAVLRAVLDMAVRDGSLGRNPAAAVKRPAVAHSEARFLTAVEARAFLDAGADSRFAPLFELLTRTGLRRGEALALRWRDVDLDRGLAKVRGTLARVAGELTVTAPKSAKSRRTVPLSADAVAVLRGLRERQTQERRTAGSQWHDSGFVFTTALGAPVDPRNALRAAKATAAKAGLEGVGLHTLRHSAATVMLTGGVPLTTVSKLLGHSSTAVTGDVYSHVTEDVSREALDTLSKALSS